MQFSHGLNEVQLPVVHHGTTNQPKLDISTNGHTEEHQDAQPSVSPWTCDSHPCVPTTTATQG